VIPASSKEESDEIKRQGGNCYGAGQGIGRAIALKMASEGAKICVADLNPETAKKVAEEIKGMGGKAIAVQVDITSLDQVKKTVEKAIAELGCVDILVNNVGWDKMELFIQSEPATWDKVININFKGPVNFFKAVLPHMIERKYGKIVSIAPTPDGWDRAARRFTRERKGASFPSRKPLRGKWPVTGST